MSVFFPVVGAALSRYPITYTSDSLNYLLITKWDTTVAAKTFPHNKCYLLTMDLHIYKV